MKEESLLQEKVKEVQRDINRWARKNGVIGDGELLIVTVRPHVEASLLSMLPKDFFSVSRLREFEKTRGIAMRAHNGAANSSLNGPTVIHKDMASWLSEYNDVKKLYRIRSLGKQCVEAMVKLLNKEGLTIADSEHLLD